MADHIAVEEDRCSHSLVVEEEALRSRHIFEVGCYCQRCVEMITFDLPISLRNALVPSVVRLSWIVGHCACAY